uniref:SERRATE/Ars2 C-terminal domain-containing protein n=1 Tax=Strix occidentalis caurina TaxID=311401 RepID=A0A8D0FCK9_STROC
MPNRCGIVHVRGPLPPNRVSHGEVAEWQKGFEERLGPLLAGREALPEEEAQRLGRKDPEQELEKFVTANTQELGKDKWLCPLSGKKFKVRAWGGHGGHPGSSWGRGVGALVRKSRAGTSPGAPQWGEVQGRGLGGTQGTPRGRWGHPGTSWGRGVGAFKRRKVTVGHGDVGDTQELGRDKGSVLSAARSSRSGSWGTLGTPRGRWGHPGTTWGRWGQPGAGRG